MSQNRQIAFVLTINQVNELLNLAEAATPMEYECDGNQFSINPLEVTVSALTRVAEATENFKPFAPLIEIFFKLGEDIVTLYQKAEHNEHLSSYLTKRVNSAVAVIKDLEIRKQENQEFFKESANLQLIKDFLKCMLDIRKFVADVSQLGSFGTFFNSNNIIQKYKDLSSKFDGYMNSLNLAINMSTIRYFQSLNQETGELLEYAKEMKDDFNVMNKETELQYQIKVIRTDLTKMKKVWTATVMLCKILMFMHEMSDSKSGSDTFTSMKRIRDLNVRYQRDLRKGAEVSIEHRSFLKLEDYEPKFECPPRGKTIHCRWNSAFLLEYAFKEIPQITDDQKKDLSQQVAILKELKDSEHIIRFYGIAVSSDDLKYYLVTEWMENGNLREYYKNNKLDW
ncbi:11378_t:CDS:2, partial [Dentiscutata heterogama]